MNIRRSIIKLVILIAIVFIILNVLSAISTILEYNLSLNQLENYSDDWMIMQLYNTTIKPFVIGVIVILAGFFSIPIYVDIYKYIDMKIKERNEEN